METVAQKANIAPRRLVSSLRHLITRRIFIEPSPEHVAHSPMSLLLRRPDCRGWVGHFTLEGTKCIAAMPKQYELFGGMDLNSFHSSVNVAYDNFEKNPMELQATGEPRASQFNAAMSWFSGFGAVHDKHIVEGFPWTEFEGLDIVDVRAPCLFRSISGYLRYTRNSWLG